MPRRRSRHTVVGGKPSTKLRQSQEVTRPITRSRGTRAGRLSSDLRRAAVTRVWSVSPDDAVARLGSGKKVRRTNGRDAAADRYGVGDLRVGCAGETRATVEGMQVGTDGDTASGLAMTQVTEPMQHGAVLDEHQQERQQPGE